MDEFTKRQAEMIIVMGVDSVLADGFVGYVELSEDHRAFVLEDFLGVLRKPENFERTIGEALDDYRNSIGEANIASYAAALAVGKDPDEVCLCLDGKHNTVDDEIAKMRRSAQYN
jgi:hypothetical protein